MDCCFIFSGQGSHRPGMGINLYKHSSMAKSKIDLADSVLGYKISQIMFDDNEPVLKKTINAQVAIYIHSCILFDIIRESKYNPVAVAGHSLGEFSALYANGTYSFEDGLEIVKTRAQAMHQCETNNKGKMSAVMGLSKETISKVCNNSNTRIIPLNVSGAFHSKLMSEAKPKLKDIISEKIFQTPHCPIVSNYDAKDKTSTDEIKHALIEQIDNTVLWLESVKQLGNINGNFIEIGPKKVLTGLIKKINESFHISSFNSYNDTKQLLNV